MEDSKPFVYVGGGGGGGGVKHDRGRKVENIENKRREGRNEL